MLLLCFGSFLGGCFSRRLGGSFGFCCFGCGSGLLRAAAACGLGFLGFAEHVLVEIHEFDEAHLGVVAEAVAGFEDACVTAGTVAYFSGYC